MFPSDMTVLRRSSIFILSGKKSVTTQTRLKWTTNSHFLCPTNEEFRRLQSANVNGTTNLDRIAGTTTSGAPTFVSASLERFINHSKEYKSSRQRSGQTKECNATIYQRNNPITSWFNLGMPLMETISRQKG